MASLRLKLQKNLDQTSNKGNFLNGFDTLEDILKSQHTFLYIKFQILNAELQTNLD
jgi:hypothetical protein